MLSFFWQEPTCIIVIILSTKIFAYISIKNKRSGKSRRSLFPLHSMNFIAVQTCSIPFRWSRTDGRCRSSLHARYWLRTYRAHYTCSFRHGRKPSRCDPEHDGTRKHCCWPLFWLLQRKNSTSGCRCRRRDHPPGFSAGSTCRRHNWNRTRHYIAVLP